jgi:hypothetical protein
MGSEKEGFLKTEGQRDRVMYHKLQLVGCPRFISRHKDKHRGTETQRHRGVLKTEGQRDREVLKTEGQRDREGVT